MKTRRLARLVLPAMVGAITLGAGRPLPYPGLGRIRWLGLGGGSTPDSNQVSIEQDLLLARRVLGRPVAMLYAGGAGTRAVQVGDPTLKTDGLEARLGRLFAPRTGRRSRYRETQLSPTGPARADALERKLANALSRGETTLYVAAHGSHGDAPRDAEVQLWGGWSVSVPEVAKLAAKAPPDASLRLVLTSCFSGGFAEVIFEDATEARGLAAGATRCGLFATTWDRAASGCDPNPDRGAHEGYGIHFLHALRGEDRDGKRLHASEIDLDGDGVVSLLEAHTRVRLASRTLDVPTTTSERWLRARAPKKGKTSKVHLPEEEAVLTRLGARLGLAAPKAARKLEQEQDELEAIDVELAKAREATDEAWWDLSGLILSRYPTLDDPYHPNYAKNLARDREAIRKLLDTHPLAKAYRQRKRDEHKLGARADAIELQSAAVERLVRARDNLLLAGRLKAAGGEAWKTFQRLRACERGLMR